jgi:hypothetical protein
LSNDVLNTKGVLSLLAAPRLILGSLLFNVVERGERLIAAPVDSVG